MRVVASHSILFLCCCSGIYAHAMLFRCCAFRRRCLQPGRRGAQCCSRRSARFLRACAQNTLLFNLQATKVRRSDEDMQGSPTTGKKTIRISRRAWLRQSQFSCYREEVRANGGARLRFFYFFFLFLRSVLFPQCTHHKGMVNRSAVRETRLQTTCIHFFFHVASCSHRCAHHNRRIPQSIKVTLCLGRAV